MDERFQLHRAWLFAALIAGAAFYVLRDAHGIGALRIALKMATAACLAAYILPASRRFAVVLALASLGDGLIEANIYLGAAAFIAAHLTAIAFYRSYRRAEQTPSQRLAAGALVVITPILAFLVLPRPADPAGFAIYAPIVGAMAAAAWLSAFPRYRTGIGAVLFVASDLLIFARPGALAGSALPGLAVWPLYLAAQVLITVGVAQGLRRIAAGAAR